MNPILCSWKKSIALPSCISSAGKLRMFFNHAESSLITRLTSLFFSPHENTPCLLFGVVADASALHPTHISRTPLFAKNIMHVPLKCTWVTSFRPKVRRQRCQFCSSQKPTCSTFAAVSKTIIRHKTCFEFLSNAPC